MVIKLYPIRNDVACKFTLFVYRVYSYVGNLILIYFYGWIFVRCGRMFWWLKARKTRVQMTGALCASVWIDWDRQLIITWQWFLSDQQSRKCSIKTGRKENFPFLFSFFWDRLPDSTLCSCCKLLEKAYNCLMHRQELF